MTKQRQKVGHNVKRVVQSDRNCMKAFHDCNAMKREHLNEFITNNRIQKWEWDKIIEHVKEPNTGEFIWVRGERYDEFARQHGMDNYCEHKAKGSSNQDGYKHHDLGIADHYCFNMTQEERDSVRTESHQRYEFEEYANLLTRSDDETERDKGFQMLQDLKENNVSMCDLAYTSRDNIEIGFEITTVNYTKEMVQAKENYCNMAGLHFVANQV